jgi:hypothetical protein
MSAPVPEEAKVSTRFRGRRLRDDERDGAVADPGDRREVALHVEGTLEVHVVHDRLAADRADEQRVAVGRAAGRRFGADHHAGARLVVDHHRLAKARGELLGESARHDVDAAAGRKRHDDARRLRRIGLRLRERA